MGKKGKGEKGKERQRKGFYPFNLFLFPLALSGVAMGTASGAGAPGLFQVLLNQYSRVPQGGAGDDFDGLVGQQLLGLGSQAGGNDVGHSQFVQPLGEAPGLIGEVRAPAPGPGGCRCWRSTRRSGRHLRTFQRACRRSPAGRISGTRAAGGLP